MFNTGRKKGGADQEEPFGQETLMLGEVGEQRSHCCCTSEGVEWLVSADAVEGRRRMESQEVKAQMRQGAAADARGESLVQARRDARLRAKAMARGITLA